MRVCGTECCPSSSLLLFNEKCHGFIFGLIFGIPTEGASCA